jgi:quercetin dioxygenase-like cupin family protein
MLLTAEKLILKQISSPDEVRELPKLRIEVVHINEQTIMRATFQPGWRWSVDAKPYIGTESCEVEHLVYILSGRLGTRMNDGTVFEGGPGDIAFIPPGHDGWVIGYEPAVILDFSGGKTYGKRE